MGQNDPDTRPADAPTSSPNACDRCETDSESGPVREGGGTTGANNLSPMQASRTGGATGGIDPAGRTPAKSGRVEPDPGR